MAEPAASAGEALVGGWWADGTGSQALYQRLRRSSPEAWRRALAEIAADDGPPPVPAPDRPTPRMADLPEVQALRADMQDRRVPFDTLERLIRALAMAAQAMNNKRPLEWSAEDIAAHCLAQREGAEGNFWTTLEAAREFWAWHPDRPYVEAQARRLQALLGRLAGGAEAGSAGGARAGTSA